MEKRYKPKEVELRLIKKWKELGIYVYNSENNAPVYSVDTPPPYISADHLHLGHAMSYIQAEIIVRYNRMLGRNIFYPMGFDDNGLPTERFIEKKYKINKDKISKTEFINLCIEETERGSRTYKRIWDRLGIGVDWLLKYNTIGEFPREIAQKSFLDLYKKQLVYSEEAPIFWCTTCKTALAQADLEDKKEESKMYYVKFFLPSDDYLIIATSRPEMIPACVAIYVNPEDDRFKEFIGSEISTPIFNSKVPIFASEEVDIQLGTGAMMVCTWGDAGDVEKWKMDKLETKILVNKVGRLTEIAGEFQGLKLKEARKAIVQKLEEEGSLDKKENLEHIVNIHERCLTPVEFVTSKQWFIRILDHKEDFLKKGDEIEWCPEFMKERYCNWVSGLRWDWCISRDRFYGVPFPVWHCECGNIILPKESDLPVDPRESIPEGLQCACGSTNLIGEKQVMDTWMTSSLTPLINAKWKTKDALMDKIYPMSIRVQAFEIIRTWLFYTVVKSFFHTESIPWKSVMISGWGLDSKGRKMSKSVGNIVTIDSAIEKYSSDAIRWWSTNAGLGQNLKHSENDLKVGVKITNKLWNVGRFIEPIIKDINSKNIGKIVNFSDLWILAELQKTIKNCTDFFSKNDFNKVRIALEKFFWIKYCDTYLELCKDRTWNPDKYSEEHVLSLKYTLRFSIEVLLKLFAPILPFVTEEIYHTLLNKSENESIHVAEWPEIVEAYVDDEFLNLGPSLLEAVNKIRSFKTSIVGSNRLEISSLSLISDNSLLRGAIKDLAGLAKAKEGLVGQQIKGERYSIKGGQIILKK